jgi:hypothetical protein
MDAGVNRRKVRYLREPAAQAQGEPDDLPGIPSTQHHGVPDPLDEFGFVLRPEPGGLGGEADRDLGRPLIALSFGESGVATQVCNEGNCDDLAPPFCDIGVKSPRHNRSMTHLRIGCGDRA